MALRVPKAELPAELRDSMIEQLGAVPEPVEVSYHHPQVARSSQEFSARIEVASEPAVVSLEAADGQVTRVYLVRNPHKLARLDNTAYLVRRR